MAVEEAAARSLAQSSEITARRRTEAPACGDTQPASAPVREADASQERAPRAWRMAGVLLPVAFLLAVEVLVRAQVLPDNLVPAPSEIAQALWQLGGTTLLKHIVQSTARVAAGFACGALLAVVVGAAMGLSRRLDALLDPSFQALRAIPSLAWVPVLLLWMGIDEAPKITLVAIGAFFPVHLSVLSGVRNVDRKLVELGAVYRLSSWRLFVRILLPAALPHIFTGLRTGLAVSWMFVVAAELIAATRGLGYLLSDGRETGRPDIVFGAIILLGLLGKFTDSAMKALEAHVLAWRDTSVEGVRT
ncbi:ABC transporter permease [Paraburkholderia silvatlantica]|uniref:Sulfonate transport system permease protein n=1 Tax=Paraburkholderia silvatlantica TaxID=321895 RepID=A0ABR6FVQ2_9BURK|nr:ABC transporter permease [Paraburkholderia silvatlantica]MBB2931521.1 sulfonate transport system permease protein [Paraburkholderia silvatlantica]PVY27815.1 sulfonate transport system permease protein [Paraburkholderia silvatlantica]PXW34662.1 sulfonate transport system permease protein [Paraburkholderia silvatlantica]